MSGTREKFNAVFFAAIMVLSMVAMSAAFAAPAAAVSPNGNFDTGSPVVAEETEHSFNVSADAAADEVVSSSLQNVTVNYTADGSVDNADNLVDGLTADNVSVGNASGSLDIGSVDASGSTITIELANDASIANPEDVNVTIEDAQNPDTVADHDVEVRLGATNGNEDTVTFTGASGLSTAPIISVSPETEVAGTGDDVEYTVSLTNGTDDPIQGNTITYTTGPGDGVNVTTDTIDTDSNGEATFNISSNAEGSFTPTFDEDGAASGAPAQSVSAELLVTDQSTAFIDGDIGDTQLNPIQDDEDITLTVTDTDNSTVIVDEVQFSDFNTLSTNNPFVESAGFTSGDVDADDRGEYFLELATAGEVTYNFEADLENFNSFDGDVTVGPGDQNDRNIRLTRQVTPDDIDVEFDPGQSTDIDSEIDATVTVTTDDRPAGNGLPLEDTPVVATFDDNGDDVANANGVQVNTTTQDTNSDGEATFTFSVDSGNIDDIEEVVEATNVTFEATEGDNVITDETTLEFVPSVGDTGTLSGSVDVIDEDLQLGTQSNIENTAGVEVHAVQFDRVADNTVQVNKTNGAAENVSALNASNETKLQDIGITDLENDDNVSFTTGDVYDTLNNDVADNGDVTLTQGEAFRVVTFSEGEPVVQDPRSDYLTHTPEGVELIQNETDRTVEVFTDNGTPVSFDVTPLSPSENYQVQQKVVIENTSTNESATFYQNITVDTDLSGANSFQASPDSTFEASEDLTYDGTVDRYDQDQDERDDRIISTDETNEQGNFELLNLPVDVDGTQQYAVIAGGDNTNDSTTAYGFANFRGFDIVDVEANTNRQQLDTDLSVQEFTPVESITVDLDVTVDDGDKTTRAPVGEAVSVEVSGTQSERGVDDESSPAQGLDVTLEALDSSIGEFVDSESDTVDVTLDENGEASVFFTGDEPTTGTTNVSASADVGTETFETEGGEQAEIDIFTDIEVTGDIVNENQDNIPGAQAYLYDTDEFDDSGLDLEDLPELDADENSTLVDTAISGGGGSYVFTNIESGQNLSIYAQALDGNDEIVDNSRTLGTDIQSSLGGEDIVIIGASPEQPLQPANFEVSDLEPEEATIQQGDDLTVSANITNTGGIEATQPVDLAVESEDGTTIPLDSRDVTLDGEGESTSVEFTVEDVDLDAGDYTHSIATSNDEATGSLTVNAADEEVPATFELSELSPQDATVDVGGDPITVSADVDNTGDVEGTQTVTLEVTNASGDVVYSDDSEETVGAGANTTVEFTDVPAGDLDAGDYTHTVASENESIEGTLTVEEDAPAYYTLTLSHSIADRTAQTTTISTFSTYRQSGSTALLPRNVYRYTRTHTGGQR
jgi:surface glycoprotein (TIGR04207 family)